MAGKTFMMRSKMWVYNGMAAWRFMNVDKKISKEIKELASKKKAKGFGSVKVTAKVGKTKWETSIFPDKQSETYLLPIKAAVRKAEQMDDDEPIEFSITPKL